jgi:hypothetical protein
LENLYGGIGGALKHRWTGWRAGLLFPKELEAQHRIGLKPSVKHTVMNGPLSCTWALYDLYKGKRVDHLYGDSKNEAEASAEAVVEPEAKTVRFRRPRVQGDSQD